MIASVRAGRFDAVVHPEGAGEYFNHVISNPFVAFIRIGFLRPGDMHIDLRERKGRVEYHEALIRVVALDKDETRDGDKIRDGDKGIDVMRVSDRAGHLSINAM